MMHENPHKTFLFHNYIITIQLLHSECSENAKIQLRMLYPSDGEKSCRSQHYSSCIGILLYFILFFCLKMHS